MRESIIAISNVAAFSNTLFPGYGAWATPPPNMRLHPVPGMPGADAVHAHGPYIPILTQADYDGITAASRAEAKNQRRTQVILAALVVVCAISALGVIGWSLYRYRTKLDAYNAEQQALPTHERPPAARNAPAVKTQSPCGSKAHNVADFSQVKTTAGQAPLSTLADTPARRNGTHAAGHRHDVGCGCRGEVK